MADNTPTPVQVEIWSDPQCIWCYITQPRLRAAVADFGGQVEVTHRSFDLSPHAPVDIDRDAHVRSHSAMPPDRRDRVLGRLAELARAEGLTYRPHHTQPTNSHLALELLHHASATGRRAQLTERLFTAYFAEGRHIGHLEDLVTLAAEIGLDPEHAAKALVERRHVRAVDRDTERARSLGATGAPFIVIDNTWGLPGAQSRQTYLIALERAATS